MHGRSSPTGAGVEENLRLAHHSEDLHPEETEHLSLDHISASIALQLKNKTFKPDANIYLVS